MQRIKYKSSSPRIFTYLLFKSENLKALKVGQILSPFGTSSALSVVALSPLAVDFVLLPKFADRTSASRSRQLRNDKVSQGRVSERKDMTGNNLLLVRGWTVDKNL